VQGNWNGLGSYGLLGLEIVLGLVLPCYVGSLADKHWTGGNTFLIVGFFLGIAHGVRAVWRALERTKRDAERAKRDREAARKRYYDERT
jgi:F0F1-type ATP synthase assembly protein I